MATITSLGVGSGLDLSGLLDQLNEAERAKLTPITRQKETIQSKISAFGRLEGALSQFKVATSALNGAATYEGLKSRVEGSAVQSAAGNDAAPGAYSVEVNALARAYSIATEGVAEKDSALGATQITISQANGEEMVIDIDAGKSSLEAIRDAINAQGGGVRASIVNDGGAEPYRLALNATTTGSQSAITSVDFGALNGVLNLDTGTEVEAVNASLTVNGIAITSQTNQIEGAIQGVTLSVAELGSSTVTIERDTDGMVKAVNDFVSGYNNLKRVTRELTSFNAETGAAGQLLGDNTLRNIESQLRSALSSVGGEDSPYRTLSALGITLQLNGDLRADESRIKDLATNEPEALKAFFAGNSVNEGMAGRLDSVLNVFLRSNGTLETATAGLKTTISSLDQRFERMERTIESTISRYRAQFSQLDSMIATMNSTSEYLTQQFEMMNAQLGMGRRR